MKPRSQPEKTFTLEGDETATYRLEIWPTSKCFEWQERLGQAGLETAAAALSSADREWSDLEEADFKTIASTVLNAVKREGGIDDLMKQLLSGVLRLESKGGKDVPVRITEKGSGYDQVYAGRTMHLYAIVGWVMAENLSDFIPAVRWIEGALGQLKSGGSNGDSSETQPDPTDPT